MKLIILGEPLSQMRHRYHSRGSFVQSYDPMAKAKQNVQKQLLSLISLEINKDGLNLPSDQQLHVDLTFYMEIAKSVSKRKRMSLVENLTYCDKHVDLDNCIKFILDCGNKILWVDDRFICSISARKLYALEPRTEIIISPIKESFSTGKTLS